MATRTLDFSAPSRRRDPGTSHAAGAGVPLRIHGRRKVRGKFKMVVIATGLVDADDVGRLSGFVWCLRWSGREQPLPYVVRHLPRPGRKTVLLHHEVIGRPEDGLVIDHVNGDPLDNRKQNLRICTQRENSLNRTMDAANRLGFKGVGATACNTFFAQLRINGVYHYGGTHPTPEAAARAYDTLVREHCGEFAACNFPRPGERNARNITAKDNA